MFTFRQGMRLAKEFNMVYEHPIEGEVGAMGTNCSFRERLMTNCCWHVHTFTFANSVQECLESKLKEQIVQRI